MNLKIISEYENKPLGRKEIIAEVTGSKITPSRKEIIERIAALKNVDKERVIVGRILHKFGETKSVIEARLYDKKEDAKRIEIRPIYKRHFGEEKKEAIKEDQEEKTEQKEMMKRQTEEK